jgi:type IV secretory pathway TraG/TraD family ATPase VirD4
LSPALRAAARLPDPVIFLARAFLEFGMGGLVLCAKPEEAEHWIKLAEKAGRAADLRVVSPEGSYRFNFLDYEMNQQGRGGGITENAVSVLMQCAEIANGPHNRDQGVWERSMKQLLRNSVDLCRLAREPLKIRTIYRVAVETGFAGQLLMQAEALPHDEADFEDLETVRDYFLKEWVTMAERTRSSIVMTLTSMADPFLRGALRDLCAKDTNLTPEDAFSGKIILVDLPVKEFNEMGRYAGVIWKYLFQRAAEPRVGQKLPLFLYADEAQFFVTSTDADFQSTARSASVAAAYLTQNLANLYARVRKEYVNSLLGNLQTKLFHQNADKETNHWAAETVSKVFFQRESTSVSTRVDDYDESTTTGTSTHLVLD